MITLLEDGKIRVTWKTATVKLPSGHTIQGRPETLAAITGAEVKATGEVSRIGSREWCERQL